MSRSFWSAVDPRPEDIYSRFHPKTQKESRRLNLRFFSLHSNLILRLLPKMPGLGLIGLEDMIGRQKGKVSTGGLTNTRLSLMRTVNLVSTESVS